ARGSSASGRARASCSRGPVPVFACYLQGKQAAGLLPMRGQKRVEDARERLITPAARRHAEMTASLFFIDPNNDLMIASLFFIDRNNGFCTAACSREPPPRPPLSPPGVKMVRRAVARSDLEAIGGNERIGHVALGGAHRLAQR